MRILFAVPRYHPNHDGMVSGVLAAGHEVAFLVRTVEPHEQHRRGVTLMVLPGPAPFPAVHARLRAFRPDLVIARDSGRFSYAVFLAARLVRARFLLYVQYPQGYERLGAGRRIRLALGLWPRHTVNSARPTPPCPVRGKTYDFLPFAVEPGEPKRDYPAGPPIRVLAGGKLDQERKNLVPLVRHLAPLLRDGGARLTIAGLRGADESPAYRALCSEIAAQDVAGTVSLRENLDYAESRRLYPEHDLFVLASSRERAAISPAEAMASGLPVVCGSDNGTNYFVEPGTGFVFRDGDFAAMAARVRHFAEHPAELAHMGRTARRTIAKRYSPADYERRLMEVVARRFGRPASPLPLPAVLG